MWAVSDSRSNNCATAISAPSRIHLFLHLPIAYDLKPPLARRCGRTQNYDCAYYSFPPLLCSPCAALCYDTTGCDRDPTRTLLFLSRLDDRIDTSSMAATSSLFLPPGESAGAPLFFNLFFPFFDASRHAIRPCRCLFASCHLLRRLRSLSCTFYAYYHAHCHVYYHALYHAHLSFCFTTFTWPTAGGTRLRAAFIGDMIPPCPSAPTSCTLFCRRGTLSTPRLT